MNLAAAAVKLLGWAVTRRGSGTSKLAGGGFLGRRAGAGKGCHWALMVVIVPRGIGCRGPLGPTKEVSVSKPRSYKSWAAGGQVGCRYHASLKTA